jgi:hypothetical protein
MTTEYKVYKPTNSDATKDDVRRRAVNWAPREGGFSRRALRSTLRLTPFSL